MAIESFQIAMIFASFCSVFLLKVYSLISFKKLWDIPLSNSEEELFYEETYETIPGENLGAATDVTHCMEMADQNGFNRAAIYDAGAKCFGLESDFVPEELTEA